MNSIIWRVRLRFHRFRLNRLKRRLSALQRAFYRGKRKRYLFQVKLAFPC